jgi:hypothetical protein
MTVIAVYLLGQFMYGAFNEFRIFMQILPLSLILLSEVVDAAPTTADSGFALRKTFRLLMPLTVLIIVFSTVIAGWHYWGIFDAMCQGDLGTHVVLPEGL